MKLLHYWYHHLWRTPINKADSLEQKTPKKIEKNTRKGKKLAALTSKN